MKENKRKKQSNDTFTYNYKLWIIILDVSYIDQYHTLQNQRLVYKIEILAICKKKDKFCPLMKMSISVHLDMSSKDKGL